MTMPKRSDTSKEDLDNPRSLFNERWRDFFVQNALTDLKRAENTLKIAMDLFPEKEQINSPQNMLRWDLRFAIWKLRDIRKSVAQLVAVTAVTKSVAVHDQALADIRHWTHGAFKNACAVSTKIQHHFGDIKHQELFGEEIHVLN